MSVKNIAVLETIKTKIEQMNKTQHIEILKILQNNPAVKLNENKSGVYVNLSFLPDQTLVELNDYLGYVQDQESALRSNESQKLDFKKTYFDEKEVEMSLEQNY
jgi:hypothetical protein